MINIAILLFAAAAQSSPGQGLSEQFKLRDRAQGPTPVTGFFLIPPKIPDCRTSEEAQEAVKVKREGGFEACDPERFIRPKRR